jgi:apolipoprotein N-acyltransferase
MRVPTLNSTHYRLLGALLLGAASVLAYAPFGWFALVWLMLGGLYGLLGKCGTVREGARIGAAFGFGMFIAGVSWVYVSLSVFGGMPPPVAALATFLFCAVLTSFPTLVGALFVRFSPSRWLPRALFFSALWVFAEWLRGWVLTGFPWLAVGYSQSPPSPLAGFSPVLGVYGVSLICALLGALICEVFKRWLSVEPCRTSGRLSWLRWCPALPLLTVGLFLAVGDLLRDVRWVAPQGEPLSVALLQGNIPQDMKWRPEKFSDSLRTYYRLAADHPAQLTVLPETALPAFFDQVPREYFDELKKLAMRQQGDMLFGIALGDTESGGQRYANGAVSLTANRTSSPLVNSSRRVSHGFWRWRISRCPTLRPVRQSRRRCKLPGKKLQSIFAMRMRLVRRLFGHCPRRPCSSIFQT